MEAQAPPVTPLLTALAARPEPRVAPTPDEGPRDRFSDRLARAATEAPSRRAPDEPPAAESRPAEGPVASSGERGGEPDDAEGSTTPPAEGATATAVSANGETPQEEEASGTADAVELSAEAALLAAAPAQPLPVLPEGVTTTAPEATQPATPPTAAVAATPSTGGGPGAGAPATESAEAGPLPHKAPTPDAPGVGLAVAAPEEETLEAEAGGPTEAPPEVAPPAKRTPRGATSPEQRSAATAEAPSRPEGGNAPAAPVAQPAKPRAEAETAAVEPAAPAEGEPARAGESPQDAEEVAAVVEPRAPAPVVGDAPTVERAEASPTPAAAEGPAAERGADQPAEAPRPSATRQALAHGVVDRLERSNQHAAVQRVDAARFVGRVTGAFRAAQERGGEVRLRLSPPELGALQIKLSVQDGVLTAQVEAETQQARTLLLDNLPALRDRLAEQDVRVEKFDVDVRRDGGGQAEQREPTSQERRDGAEHRPAARRPSAAPEAPNPGPPPRPGRGDGVINLVA